MRRSAAWWIVAATALLGACSGSDPSTVRFGPSATTTTSGVVAAAGGRDTTSTSQPGGRRVIIVGGTDAVGGVPSSATRPGSGGPGTAAGWYLRPKESARIVVQVLTQSGAEPTAATVSRVVDVLRSASGKPVTTVGGSVTARHDTWTDADIRSAADASPASATADSAVLRLLFVHGGSDKDENDAKVLGISPRADVAAIFSDRVAASGSGLVGTDAIERAVTTHEVGHLLGLVDLFLSTGRGDKDHPHHSTNRQSVMYWAVESTLVGDLLTGGPPQEFDAADLADLATIRRG